MTDLADWIAKFSAMDPERAPPIPAISSEFWPVVHANALAFLRERGEDAVACGFTCLELLGVHWGAGLMRVDATGKLIMTRPVTIRSIAPKLVVFSNGLVWRGNFNAQESVPIWEFSASAGPPRK
jgi:hypothetical protein